MIQKTWLAASMALSLTVGFGARILTGENAVTAASPDGVESGVAGAALRAWTIPGVKVVVQIPANADGEFVLAGSAEATPALHADARIEGAEETWTMPGITVVAQIQSKANSGFALASSILPPRAEQSNQETAEEEWTIPGITVVAQIPAKADGALALASSTAETLSARVDQTVDERAEEIWTVPGITVVARAPANVGRSFAMGAPSFPTNRPSRVRARPSRMEKPATPFRDMRRYDDRRMGERVSGI